MSIRKLVLTSLVLVLAVSVSAQLHVGSLTADYKTNPVGIDNPVPKLSWIIQSDQNNTMQASYEIRAAQDPSDLAKAKKQVWNSGKVASSQSVHIKYDGQALNSYQRVYWQVRVVDNHGEKSKWSNPAFFEIGILEDATWEANWITPTWEEDVSKSNPAPYLRKEFTLGKAIKNARLYISAQGLYQVEINGKRVGEQEFTPGWTSYNTRLQYQIYDITAQLVQKQNAIGIILGDGWFRGNLPRKRNFYGTDLAAIAQIIVEYADGSKATISTDESWKASTGPILESDIYNGEVYDANKELVWRDSIWLGT